MASAIFSAPTLKFILSKKLVGKLDLTSERRLVRAFSLSAVLERDERDSRTAAEAYIPTEYTYNKGRVTKTSLAIVKYRVCFMLERSYLLNNEKMRVYNSTVRIHSTIPIFILT